MGTAPGGGRTRCRRAARAMPSHGDAAQRSRDGSRQRLEEAGAWPSPCLGAGRAPWFPSGGCGGHILRIPCASAGVSPLLSPAGMCRLSRHPPAGREPLARLCLSFALPAKRGRRLPGSLAGRDPRPVPAQRGSPWVFFLLQMPSRAAAPGQASARTRRTANPSRWVSGAGRAQGTPKPVPRAPLAEAAPPTGGHALHAGSSHRLLWFPPAPASQCSTYNELGKVSALSHGWQSPAGTVSLGDSSCHGCPTVGVQPPALTLLSAAGKLRHRAAPGPRQRGRIRVIPCW